MLLFIIKYIICLFIDISFYFNRNLLLGLACNESTAGLYLDLSGNSLGLHGAHVLESCIHGVRVVHSLDISDNSKLE